MAAICAVWLAIGITAGIYLGSLWHARAREWAIRATRRQDRQNAAERLRLRANMQHNWVLRGDPRGIYGDYRPLDLNAVPVVPRRRRGTGGTAVLPEAKLPQ